MKSQRTGIVNVQRTLTWSGIAFSVYALLGWMAGDHPIQFFIEAVGVGWSVGLCFVAPRVLGKRTAGALIAANTVAALNLCFRGTVFGLGVFLEIAAIAVSAGVLDLAW